jgi:hypothetical protein
MGMVFYTIIHHFSSLILIYNREIKDTLNVLSRDFKFLHPGQSQSLLLLAILYLLVHLAWGFVMGLLAYLTVKRTMKRLSPKIAD